jgi:hypothetical protein
LRRPLRSFVLVLCTIPIVAGVGADGALAHDIPAGHLVRGKVVTSQGTLRLDARYQLPDTGGTALFTPAGGRQVTIDLDCVDMKFYRDVYVTYSLLTPVWAEYGHAVYASGRGSDGKRYRLQMDSLGPLVVVPTVSTKPAWKSPRYERGPCGTAWVYPAPEWIRGAILILA